MHWLVLIPGVAMAIGLGGCMFGTTNSSAGSFVTDVRLSGEELIVSDCSVDFQVNESFFLLTLDHSRSSNISKSACEQTTRQLPPGLAPAATPAAQPVAQPVPAPRRSFTDGERRRCVYPLALWRVRPLAARLETIDQLPPICRQMINPEELVQ